MTTDPRIAVLFPDGSMSVQSPHRGGAFALRAAREERDSWNRTDPKKPAKVVSIDVQDRDIVEIKDGD
jgi:hypothetical protein